MGMFDFDVEKYLEEKPRTEKIRDWIDRGGVTQLLILCLTLVSAYHVTMVFAYHEPWPVALFIALLVDAGMFNTLLTTIEERWTRKPKGKKRQPKAYVTLACSIALGGYSFYFHYLFYSKQSSSALTNAIFLIVAMVCNVWMLHRKAELINEKESKSKANENEESKKQSKSKSSGESKAIAPKAKPKAIPNQTPKQSKGKAKAKSPGYTHIEGRYYCNSCDAFPDGFENKSQAAGHMGKHRKKKKKGGSE